MEDFDSPALRRLLGAQPEAVVSTHAYLGDATAVIRASHLVEAMRFLRDDTAVAFDMLSDVCAVDYLPRVPRFEVVYHLYSLKHNHRLRVKVLVDGTAPSVPSLVALWASANWMEREVFDLYGIRFDGHPDLRRILLYDVFEGYPLRKDYPKERRQPLVGPRN